MLIEGFFKIIERADINDRTNCSLYKTLEGKDIYYSFNPCEPLLAACDACIVDANGDKLIDWSDIDNERQNGILNAVNDNNKLRIIIPAYMIPTDNGWKLKFKKYSNGAIKIWLNQHVSLEKIEKFESDYEVNPFRSNKSIDLTDKENKTLEKYHEHINEIYNEGKFYLSKKLIDMMSDMKSENKTDLEILTSVYNTLNQK